MAYEDSTISINNDGITIKRYGVLGSHRSIEFDTIMTVTEKRLGSLGRWRLVGVGPGGGSRNWYGWDGNRKSKETAFSIDVGRFWRPTVTPDNPESFLAALPQTVKVD
jgi:hypothetical protein